MNKVGRPQLPNFQDRELRDLNEKLGRVFQEIINAMNQGADGYLFPSTSVTSDYTANLNDALIVANAVSATLTVTLADPDEAESKRVSVKRINSGNNVLVFSSSRIDGSSTYTLGSQYDSLEVIADGSTWHRV